MKYLASPYLLVIVSALLLQLSLPPVNAGWMIFVALVPLLLAAEVLSWRGRFIGGVIVGLGGYIQLPFSLAGWGNEIFLGAWLVAGAMCGSFLLLSGLMASRLPPALRWLSSALAWVLVLWVSHHWVGAPLSLAVTLSLIYPEFLQFGNHFGFWAAEFILVAINSLLVVALQSRSILPLCGAAAMVVAPVWLFAAPPVEALSKKISVVAVQPAFTPADHRSSTWSLAARLRQENRLDNLTEKAVALNPDVVVWPEGGNNLFNTRVQRRNAKTHAMIADYDGLFLMSGKDLNAQGEQFNIVSVYESGAFVKNVLKVHLAPFAESVLHAGHAELVQTKVGRVAVLVCMDAVFFSHFDHLARQGADSFFVVADGSSFGYGSLSLLHASYAVAGAIYSGKPLAFVNNNGISLAADRYGRLNFLDEDGKSAGLYEFQLEGATATVPAIGQRLLAVLIVLGAVLCGMVAGRGAFPPRPVVRLSPWFLLPAVLVSLILGGALFVQRLGVGPMEIFQFAAAQRHLGPALDGVTSLFVQSDKKSCGAAAIAYMMTLLGDYVFPEQVLARPPAQPDLGYSLQEIKLIAEGRGFYAEGFRGSWDDLPGIGEPPVLMHLTESHYIVGLGRNGDQFLYFDPAVGSLITVDRTAILSRWSGNFLRVLTR